MSSQWQLEELVRCRRHSLVLTTSDGLSKIPFTVVVGAVPTPVALVIAGAHGDEYEGPAAIQDLSSELDPCTVKGAVIFVPVANPAAFAAASRRHPADNGDLNRSFPGSAAGGPTEQLAHLLLGEFALVSHCILSLHGWSKEASLLPYAEYALGDTPAMNASREAARVLGFRYLHPYHWPDGVLGNAVLPHGIPIVETEVGGATAPSRQKGKLFIMRQSSVFSRTLAWWNFIVSRYRRLSWWTTPTYLQSTRAYFEALSSQETLSLRDSTSAL
jgi:predicted deacylase